jgi:pimeloyl-ACP methyl ester carboxylesterase
MEILFVHGALVRDGAWWWSAVADRLGVRSRSVELPSCGEGGADPAANGLREDAAALRAALDDAGDAVVVGHSYGGTVIAEGADHPAVRHLVYVSSYLPEPGIPQAGIMADEADPVRTAVADGVVRLDGYDEPSFSARFLHDVADPAVRTAAWSRVAPQGLDAFATPTTVAAWRGIPSTAIVCADDRSTSAALQRAHAARATRTVELPTGHHPFLSRPDLVAAEVDRVLADLR